MILAFLMAVSSACVSRNQDSPYGATAETQSDSKTYFVDLLPLQPSVEVSQAEEYFERVGDVISRHGLKKLASYIVTQTMGGSYEVQMINFYELENEDTMPSIQNDPDYQRHVSFRNSTFVMDRVGMFTLSALTKVKFKSEPGKLYFVDFLPFQSGVTVARQEEYFKRVGKVVKKHGLKRIGGFKVEQALGTQAITPHAINLWTVESPETFPGIMGDPDYQQNVPFRNETFVMEKANMFMLTGAGR